MTGVRIRKGTYSVVDTAALPEATSPNLRARVAAWLGRTSYEGRAEMLLTIFGDRASRRYHRFAFMLALSVVIAVMGLSLNSAAVVIGAMLIAPLMTPVMRFAAALVLGLPGNLARSAIVVVVASAGSVALAWVLATMLPHQPLTAEMLSRTTPDIRDLCVALAAGAAGSYATARPDVSVALPGVAVAVALVPPLASIGLALEAGRTDLAEGATLLYVANLVAIVLSGALIFLLSGLVPRRRLADVTPRVAGWYGAVLVAALIVGIPLAARSVAVADRFRDQEAVAAATATWLGPSSPLDVQEVNINGNVVTIDLAGPDVPPINEELTARVSAELGRPVTVNVRWQQRSDLTATGPVHSGISQAQLRTITERWLQDAAEKGPVDRINSIEFSGRELLLELSGAQTPPPANSLATLIEDTYALKPVVKVSWTQQIVDESGEVSAQAEMRARALTAAESWARSMPDIDVLDVSYAKSRVVVDLAGTTPPPSTNPIVKAIRDATGRHVTVQVRFVERRALN